jgi:cell division protein FtsB
MKYIYFIAIISLIGLTGVGYTRDLNLQNNTQQSTNVSKVNVIDKLNKQVAVLTKEVNLLKKEIKKLNSSRPEGFVKTKDNRYIFSANGAKFEIGRKGEVMIKAMKNLKLESVLSTKIKAGVGVDINSTANMNIRAATKMSIDSSLIQLNKGSKPVSYLHSIVTGATAFGPLQDGKVIQGSPTVLVP